MLPSDMSFDAYITLVRERNAYLLTVGVFTDFEEVGGVE